MERSGIIVLPVIAIAIALGSGDPAAAQPPEKRFLTRDGARPTGLFAPGIMVGKTVYVAGKGDYRPNEDFPEKVANCLNEVRGTLQQAGLDLGDVVKSFVYLEDPEMYDEFNTEYAKFFPEDPPARTTLGVAQVPGESRLEITCIAYSDPSERRRIGDPPGGFPFSPGILAGDTLYISGKGDQLPGGGHPEGFEEQVRQAMRNVEATLRQAGLGFEHVVMSHVFLDDPANVAAASAVYGEFFDDGNEPACATVAVDWIPGGSHVEITCIATTDLDGRAVVRVVEAEEGLDGAVVASPAVWAGDTLYLSGLSGIGPDPGEDLGDQVHRMARRHSSILREAGLGLENIVSGCVYLQDMEDYQPMNAIYREYFSRGPGVRTCLMPNSGSGEIGGRVVASFIAARTR
ncbi:RidA family protein [Tautonia sociabilis]|uniref:RidA family protein n=1 Tax=Tautonia sociabilis TaxID=2080755 RepID=A0A432MML4_9BACT|nr:RidA family protein [Tautonia sociabilis]RUL88308.1 RidA family protein [Tautonia sociabilis]